MIRRCEPLFDGDTREVCGARFDDARRLTYCPHVSLDGGDTVGVPPDPEYLRTIGILVPDGTADVEDGARVVHRTDTRYALVDVLDLAVLLQTAHGQEKYDGAVLDRVEKAPLATVPCTIKLNADGGVWITPDQPAPDPRRRQGVVDMIRNVSTADDMARNQVRVQSVAEQPLPLLEEFGHDGHHRDCEARASRFALSPNVAPCLCALRAVTLARATRQALEREPARMVFTPARPPNVVRTYGLRHARDLAGVVGFLNDHRECEPIAVVPPSGDGQGFVVVYVQEVQR